MRLIQAMGRANGGDLLTATNDLAPMNQDSIAVVAPDAEAAPQQR